MSVLEAIRETAHFFEEKGIESPRLNGEAIIAHVLRLPRLQLYLQFDRDLAESEVSSIHELRRRRGEREPLQHVLGTTNFCGLELLVTPNVLIPRPETELLADRAVHFLKRHAGIVNGGPKGGPSSSVTVLDLGTGSGCLPIYMARQLPEVRFTAIEKSPAALGIAVENARRHGVDSRIEFVEADAFGALAAEQQFDLIVSNPPYVPSAEIERLEPEVREYEPRPALDGGPDGLDYYRRIAIQASGALKPNGRLMLELGYNQAEAIAEILQSQMWIVEGIEPDYGHVPRILTASLRHPSAQTASQTNR